MAITDKKSSKSQSHDSAPAGDVIADPRFSAVYSDPRFSKVSRKANKVAVDDRFKRILHDKDFARKASVDKWGRKLKRNSARDEIKRLYTFEGEEEEDEKEKGKDIEKKKGEDEEDDEEDSSSDGEEEDSDDDDVPVKFDPARGEGIISTSEESSDDDSSEESGSDSDEEVIEEDAANVSEAQKKLDDVPVGDISRRIAAVNLDWDHVRAIDLFATFSSFVPVGGKIERISIYPSEFGKERMEREEMEGPPKEIFSGKPDEKPKNGDSKKKGAEDEEITAASIIKEDKGEEFDSARLRKYQLERLRYYYAIIECDSPVTANNIYKECDGAEYEATANFFDLRFVPDDTTFDDKPRDEWTGEAVSNYKPNDFVTDALQHSKVKLTWDQDDQMRKQVVKEAFSRRDLEDMDLKAYLASSDSESDEENAEELRRQYREKLSLPSESSKDKNDSKGKKPVGDMEVTFTSALSGGGDAANGDVFEKEETTIEKYQRKERERRKKRKGKMKAGRSGEAGEEGSDAGDNSDEEMGEAGEAAAEDLGFNDPFFDDAPAKVDKKKEKKMKKEKKAAEEAVNAAERAKLEAIMNDGKSAGDDEEKLEHYNMRNIMKAEKATKLKGKAAKRSKNKLLKAEGLQDDFKMDVKDPRFKALFDNPEYAIDPTNPKFKKTNAMAKILEEKRKRRGNGEEGDGEDAERKKAKKRKVEKQQSGGGTNRRDIDSLVRSVKDKSKKSKK